ncbi:glycosyl transferase [Paracidovorax sp. MALMAid1276]|uniref:glycosyl transferase n=1 Tax=Paracidovorax sp. MALMAid1276 TaxID=3411631 RepID=UPI003B998341
MLRVLDLLAQHRCRVWLTLNIHDPLVMERLGEARAEGAHSVGFADVHVIRNPFPQGFGANHNQAFACDQAHPHPSLYFAVLNPDLDWASNPWPDLLAVVASERVGCVYPVQRAAGGHPQDHRRLLPTPGALWRRYLRLPRPPECEHRAPDWVNAAMLLFPAAVYRELGGFDERYHMYCEDVDLCLRLQLAGHRLVQVSTVHVTHEAQRASHRQWRHFAWHVRSLMRLWWSQPYAQYRRRREMGELPAPEK